MTYEKNTEASKMLLCCAILREDLQFADSDKACAYCGATGNMTIDHIIPKSLHINDRCATCDKIQGIHNIVYACKHCNSAKGDMGLYTFFNKLNGTHHNSDLVPPPLFYKHTQNAAGSFFKAIMFQQILSVSRA